MARFRDDHQTRSAGLAQEVAFWDNFLATRGEPWGTDFAERLDPTFPLQSYLAQLIVRPPGSVVRILDVGAGPLTFVGKVADRWTLEITAVDPLADEYDKLLALHEIEPPVRTQPGAAEQLTRLFARDTFDIVTARNALDHGVDPAGAIRQLVAVCKAGGAVSLHHAINEADRQGNWGLHQWNFSAESGAFMVAGPRRRVNMNRYLADCAIVRTETYGDEWISNVIVKRPRDARQRLATAARPISNLRSGRWWVRRHKDGG